MLHFRTSFSDSRRRCFFLFFCGDCRHWFEYQMQGYRSSCEGIFVNANPQCSFPGYHHLWFCSEGWRHQLLNEICSERGNNEDGDPCHDKGFEGHDSCFKCSEVCDSFEVNQKLLPRRKGKGSRVKHAGDKSLFHIIYVIIGSPLIHVLFHIFKRASARGCPIRKHFATAPYPRVETGTRKQGLIASLLPTYEDGLCPLL